MPRLTGKVVIVTGASSGLGRPISLAFAAEDARLVVCADLQPEAREEIPSEREIPTHELICKSYGNERATFVKTDVTVAAHIEACVQKAVETAGELHVMVNNAGVAPMGIRLHEMEEKTWDETMKINVRGVFLGCKYACRQFLTQGNAASEHRGWIINTASVAGLQGVPDGPAYAASKAAVVSLTKSLALDYAKERIHVNAICPGAMKTALTKWMHDDEHISALFASRTRWNNGLDGRLQDVANGAVFLASDDAAWVTGVALPIDGGWAAG